jgi:hypothetical protein
MVSSVLAERLLVGFVAVRVVIVDSPESVGRAGRLNATVWSCASAGLHKKNVRTSARLERWAVRS